jgi:hypothetical protein
VLAAGRAATRLTRPAAAPAADPEGKPGRDGLVGEYHDTTAMGRIAAE